MFAVVVGDIYMKTLVAIIVIFNILGQCEMSIYPGLRRRPMQQAPASFEVNSDFLAQLMEENARRRLQQQFEQNIELINMQLERQRQREERLRERYRQQQLAAMAAENEDYEYMRKFKEQNLNSNNNNLQQYDQYDNSNSDFSYKYQTLNKLDSSREGIKFAVPPSDPRYYETDEHQNEEEDDEMDGDGYNNEENQIREDENVNDDVVGVEVDKEEDLDSRVLEEYEEYTPRKEGDDDKENNKNQVTSTMVLSPGQSGVSSPASINANFHRIKPQTAAAAAAAGVNTVNVKQAYNGGAAPARQDITTLIDKLHPKQDQSHEGDINEGHMVIREHLGMKGEMGMYVVALIAGVSAAATVGLFVLGIAWYTFHNKSKATADVDYPAYGVTGPNKDITPSGDRKLAQSAQMYHYQHQKQQIIAMENRQNNEENCEMSYVESDDDNEEGDYTVYECPGLAPTGEMEVKNPLFLDDTPVTPATLNQLIRPLFSAQQPKVKKITEKAQPTTCSMLPNPANRNSSEATAPNTTIPIAPSSEDKKQKKSKK